MTTANTLNQARLAQVRPDIAIPTYDRTALLQHTVHMGVGSFHRAHQAVYLDDLLKLPETERWGECGLGVLSSDRRMYEALKPQDCLYTVVERSAHTQQARVIGSMVDYLYAPPEREAVIEKIAHPDSRILSLTITEGGYFLDEGTGEFDDKHPDIQHDLLHPHTPVSSLGLIAEALDRRRRRQLPPLTVMSCDNLQSNGEVTKRVLETFSGMLRPDLRQWISQNVAFPNGMVDRITPATTPADIAMLSDSFGLADAWPVVTEPFRQWVIEDHFCAGRPQWERVGAQIVTDVAPYEIMKIRLLNGSHLAMGYLGAIAGFTYVHEVMQDPLFLNFIEAFMEQVTPVVPRIAGTSIPEYRSTLIARFSNPTINDQVTRICSEGSAKMPKWLLPSIVDLLTQHAPTRLLSLVVASWIHYLGRERDERGQPMQILDARSAELTKLAKGIAPDPRPMLAVRSIFGDVLPAEASFVAEVEQALQLLRRAGAAATVRSYLATSEQIP